VSAGSDVSDNCAREMKCWISMAAELIRFSSLRLNFFGVAQRARIDRQTKLTMTTGRTMAAPIRI
jgi:hypothetical protein